MPSCGGKDSWKGGFAVWSEKEYDGDSGDDDDRDEFTWLG